MAGLASMRVVSPRSTFAAADGDVRYEITHSSASANALKLLAFGFLSISLGNARGSETAEIPQFPPARAAVESVCGRNRKSAAQRLHGATKAAYLGLNAGYIHRVRLTGTLLATGKPHPAAVRP